MEMFDFSKVIVMDHTSKPTEGEMMIEHLVPGLIEENTLSVIAAPSFAGKSWVAMGIARCVNDPNYKFIGFGTEVERPVLYVDKEMGTKQFKDRWNRLGGQWEPGNTFHYADLTGEYFSLAERSHVEALAGFVVAKGIEFVVIDSLGAASGGAEENSNSTMLAVMDNVKVLRAVCAVMIIHHTGKNAKKDDLDSNALRGASAIRDQCDNVFFVNTHEGTHRTLRENKRRNKAGEIEDYAFNMLFDGGNVSFELEDKIKPISADFQRVVQTLIDLDAPQSGNALKKALRQAGLTVKNDDFNPMLERMEREGLIEIDRTSGRGWKITVSDLGRERYEEVDLMTGYRDSELVDEFEQEEHDTVTEDECDTCGYSPCECDA